MDDRNETIGRKIREAQLDKVPYMHFIWHLFVLGGSVCHWVCVTFYVLPKE